MSILFIISGMILVWLTVSCVFESWSSVTSRAWTFSEGWACSVKFDARWGITDDLISSAGFALKGFRTQKADAYPHLFMQVHIRTYLSDTFIWVTVVLFCLHLHHTFLIACVIFGDLDHTFHDIVWRISIRLCVKYFYRYYIILFVEILLPTNETR